MAFFLHFIIYYVNNKLNIISESLMCNFIRILKIKQPKIYLANTFLNDYKFAIPENHKKNQQIYCFSDNEEFYDDNTNWVLLQLLTQSEHYYTPILSQEQPLYEYELIRERNDEFMLSIEYQINSMLNFCKKNNFISRIFNNKNLSIMQIAERYSVNKKSLVQDSVHIKNSANSYQQFLVNLTDFHPVYLLHIPENISQQDYFFVLKTNFSDFFTSIDNTYKKVLKQISEKEGVSFENNHVFYCDRIDISAYKNLASKIAIQDFCLLHNMITGSIQQHMPYEPPICFYLWREMIGYNQECQQVDQMLCAGFFNNVAHINLFHEDFEAILNLLLVHNKEKLLYEIIKNPEFSQFHAFINLIIDNKKLKSDIQTRSDKISITRL